MLGSVTRPKVLTVAAAGLAVWMAGGMWIIGSYMLSGVERSISELRAEAGARFSAREQEESAARSELAQATRELRLEVAALRHEVGTLGDRVVASNAKVGDRIGALRKELAGAAHRQRERFEMALVETALIDWWTDDLRHESVFSVPSSSGELQPARAEARSSFDVREAQP